MYEQRKTILVTGDSGFIGSYLISFLDESGYLVRGIDLVPKKNPGINYLQVVGDILDETAIGQAMQGCDCVIHLAAEHKDFGIAEERYFQVNVEGTQKLLTQASFRNIKKFIFFSSVAVYGDTVSPSEETVPNPVNPYGTSKFMAEQVIRKWVEEDPSRQAIILRPTVVFGPRNRANIFKLIQYVCDKKFIWIGKGKNIKSIAYVENVVGATCFLLENMKPGFQILNYVDEPQLTTRELVTIIAAKADLPVPTFYIPLSVALPAAKVLDVVGALAHRDFPVTSARLKKFNTSTTFQSEKIRSLGFMTPYSLEEGIEKNVRWYRHEESLSTTPSYASYE